ncbi:hypothetical protein [Actinoplanes sp. NPDC048796]|uniref:hypothetical protein n=1 Tax=Actinoplanes sp. NPDC048796 TaxID=3155640 RepID=UPI0034001C66
MGLEALVPLIMGALLQVAGRVGAGALDAVGEAAKAQASTVFGKVKSWFAGDPPAAGDLDRFADDPDLYQSVIQARLIRKLTADEAMRDELAALFARQGPEVQVFQTIAESHGITGAKVTEMVSGRLTVRQDIRASSDSKGVDINRLG